MSAHTKPTAATKPTVIDTIQGVAFGYEENVNAAHDLMRAIDKLTIDPDVVPDERDRNMLCALCDLLGYHVGELKTMRDDILYVVKTQGAQPAPVQQAAA